MNSIIKEFEKIYTWKKKITFYPSENINILAHKDRVWFFVVNNQDNNKFILYTYWNIEKNEIKKINQLFSNKTWYISVKILDINGKYVTIISDNKLKTDDFLMYVPNFYINDWWLYWPYLDNLLSQFVLSRINYKYNLWQSIDEEAKLIYSNFPKNWITIILDVLRQEYLNEKINFDKIYCISSTWFTDNLSTITWKDIQNTCLNVKFKLEVDFVESDQKYFLLCPIKNGHCETSSVKLSTLEKFENTLNLLFDKIVWKKF